MIRIPWTDFDMTTKKTTHREIDVTLQCSDCGATNFEVRNAGYAEYTTYINIDKSDPRDVSWHDSETEVGDDFECDQEYRCNECSQYCSNELNTALKTFIRIKGAKAEDQLKAYIDQVLFRPLTDEKKVLLDQLKGGLINLKLMRDPDNFDDSGACRACMDAGHDECIHS